MRINIQNVEELVFENKEVWKKMPELIHLRDQWRMSMMTPMLRALGRKSVLDFLRNAKETHEDSLSEYFGTQVTIDKIDRHLVANKSFKVSEEPDLEDAEIYTGFSCYRTKEDIHITFWR
jgi:hypothetical protein